ncbi:MAG: helix-turn-helix domain-containing protein [Clostridium sp.]
MYSFNINVQISDIELKNIIDTINKSLNLRPTKVIHVNESSTNSASKEILYTVPEIAKILKVDQHKVYELIEKKILIALKLGRLKVTRAELLRFLNEYTGKDLSDLDNIKDL